MSKTSFRNSEIRRRSSFFKPMQGIKYGSVCSCDRWRRLCKLGVLWIMVTWSHDLKK